MQADESAEYGEVRQLVPGGQVLDLGAGPVPCRREPGAGEGLQENPVEGESQQGGIGQVPCQLLGLTRRLLRVLQLGPGQIGAAALDGDRGQEAGAQVGGAVWAKPGERALGSRDDGAGLLGVVGTAPEGGHVVGADDPGGQGEVPVRSAAWMAARRSRRERTRASPPASARVRARSTVVRGPSRTPGPVHAVRAASGARSR
ncbi:hypothetical protein SHKM778_46880 [Streptomyces sp. KM77-8]|uniref:Uncharacterized protein n=1 Tax=Streptomyces haneummycinicus TaxID=3074435 RepID=A0AAT9HLH5_9ACTN